MSTLNDLQNLDFENVGGWPPAVKAIAMTFVVVLIVVAGWYFKIRDLNSENERLARQEQELFNEFERKQKKASNLEEYRAQLEEIEVILQNLLRQLPGKTEMPDLLVDISQTALSTGIENELFNPQAEIQKDFYAEKPIALRMVGTYHQFGAFVSGVASLPRVVILTMHDISLTPASGGSGNVLVLEGTAKTYRYVDEAETAGEGS